MQLTIYDIDMIREIGVDWAKCGQLNLAHVAKNKLMKKFSLRLYAKQHCRQLQLCVGDWIPASAMRSGKWTFHAAEAIERLEEAEQ